MQKKKYIAPTTKFAHMVLEILDGKDAIAHMVDPENGAVLFSEYMPIADRSPASLGTAWKAVMARVELRL